MLLAVNVIYSAIIYIAMLASVVAWLTGKQLPEDNIPYLLISLTALCLLGWAYRLCIIAGRVSAGFGVLTLAYVAWPVLLVMLCAGIAWSMWNRVRSLKAEGIKTIGVMIAHRPNWRDQHHQSIRWSCNRNLFIS